MLACATETKQRKIDAPIYSARVHSLAIAAGAFSEIPDRRGRHPAQEDEKLEVSRKHMRINSDKTRTSTAECQSVRACDAIPSHQVCR